MRLDGVQRIDGVVALSDTATQNCKGDWHAMAKIGGATQVSRDTQREAVVCAERGPVAGLATNMRAA